MRLHWLLPSCLGIFLLSSPAEAARLQSWRFDTNQNRLEFRTDDGVQPRAQLIANPTRLVIDLPGTTLGRSMVNQSYGGAIRSVRVGQFDRQTTRIVVEIAPGYTIDPQQVQVRGASPTQWTVQLPTPQRVATSPSPATTTPTTVVPSTQSEPQAATVPRAATQIQNVLVTPDGIFVRTSGADPDIDVNRSSDRRQITIDLRNAGLGSRLAQRDILVNRYGVNRLQVTQAQTSPPVVRITLNVSAAGPDWRATASNLGGIVLVPEGGVTAATTQSQQAQPTPPPTTPRPTPPPRPTTSPPPRVPSPSASSPQIGPPQSTPLATIQAVELSGDRQLLIRADRALSFTSGWDPSTASYRVSISPARLAAEVKGPQLNARSPLLGIRLRQEDPQTVVVFVQPAAGVQVGEVNQPGSQVLALELERSRVVPIGPGTTGAIPVPAPNTVNPIPSTPRVPNGRIVVVVDPGHGGPDPGAVGIGGIQEKGIVLDVSRQVAAILEQQGVQAVLTRADDRDLDLEPRVQLAQRVNASIFVSIHANAISMSRPDVNGLETYYFASGDRLARTIHNSILQRTGVRDRGVRQARFYVLRRTSMPAVLVELGFVTGQEDAARLANPAFRSQMAAAIAQGILQYIQQGL